MRAEAVKLLVVLFVRLIDYRLEKAQMSIIVVWVL